MNDAKELLSKIVDKTTTEDRDRRSMMKATAILALGSVALDATVLKATSIVRGAGKPGDFNFLSGEWKIKNRRLKDKDRNDWDEFEGEATCWTILNGLGSVEELRIPVRDFAGMGLRLLDIEKGIWNDFWVNAKNPVLTLPGLQGNFENGVGTFSAEEVEGGKTIAVKGVWDRITPDGCRWYQATSTDGAQTWEENWTMDWTRTKKGDRK